MTDTDVMVSPLSEVTDEQPANATYVIPRPRFYNCPQGELLTLELPPGTNQVTIWEDILTLYVYFFLTSRYVLTQNYVTLLPGEARRGPSCGGLPRRDAGCKWKRSYPSGCLVHVAGCRGTRDRARQVRGDRQLRAARHVRIQCTGRKTINT